MTFRSELTVNRLVSPGPTDSPVQAGALAVRPVRNGYGIVATKTFRRGALICVVEGRVVPAREVWRYWDTDPRRAENCFRFDGEHYLDPCGELGAFANHSCQPNTGVRVRRGRLVLAAIQPIAAGDEITHDYSTLLGADDVWRMRCNCGEPGCRKVVRCYPSLPPEIRRRYEALGIVPQFILDLEFGEAWPRRAQRRRA